MLFGMLGGEPNKKSPKFKKKSVNLEKFLKEIYIDNGLAYISCNVQNYNDIIDRFSVEGYEWLDERFTRFVEENAAPIPTDYPIVLEICGQQFNKTQQENIKGTISDYYALKLGDAQEDYKRHQKRMAFLSIMAALSAVLVSLTSIFQFLSSAVLTEVMFILFWISIWELFDYIAFDKKELLENKIKAAQLASMKIFFRKQFNDNPLRPAEERAVIKESVSDEELLPSDEWDD